MLSMTGFGKGSAVFDGAAAFHCGGQLREP